MAIKIKNVLKNQSIIQLTLFKVILSIVAFLMTFIYIYGQNFWNKQALQFKINLLLSASNLQSQIQSQISTVEQLKQAKDLTKNQKQLQIENIIKPIINKNTNYIFGYYDYELALIVENQNKIDISLDEIRPSFGLTNEFNKVIENNELININLPIYDNNKLVGYVFIYTKTVDYILASFKEYNQILLLVLGLSVMIIFFIRKNIKQIELYLNKFCKLIFKNDEEREQESGQILLKLPELKPVLNQIACYTDELRQINLELKLAKQKMINIMEGISDCFFALNRNWEFTFANTETQKIAQKDNIELIGKSVWEVFPQAVGSVTYDKMHEAMSQDKAYHWEAEGLTMAEQSYEYHAYPFDEGLSVFFRDITELKRQHNELARLERLNLIGQLAAGISHEIRNPLTTVKGFIQLLGTKSNYAQDKEYMDLMLNEIDRANSIITDFLSLAKSNSENILPQNINDVINKVFPMLQADAFNSNKEVAVDLGVLPDIMINESEIIQLILNLVRNALEVTPLHGCVQISTYLKDDKVVLAIKDQGSGISKEVQDKIGTPFFTTKDTGTGLGLAISIGIAQRHNAVLEFKTGNKGTIFYTLFPVCDS